MVMSGSFHTWLCEQGFFQNKLCEVSSLITKSVTRPSSSIPAWSHDQINVTYLTTGRNTYICVAKVTRKQSQAVEAIAGNCLPAPKVIAE